MNRIRIHCDPYKKHISYEVYSNENKKWREVACELSSDKYTNITIQSKLYEIVGLVDKYYNIRNGGVEITFEGTEDDYRDLCSEIEEYYEGRQISCKKGDNCLISAKDAMPKIKDIFNMANATLAEYHDEGISTELNKFIDTAGTNTIKPVIVLCVIGLQSSGKSTFINSLIGRELLPSAAIALTAKNYKVSSGINSKISFLYDNDQIEITFDGKDFCFNQPAELSIIQELNNAIVADPRNCEEAHMKAALNYLNSCDKEDPVQHIKLVEVVTPFVNSSLPLNSYDFTIYDTPGSDSIYGEHKEVLKESLSGQTNGLPIYITRMDEIEKEKNNELIAMIESFGDSLDQTGTIVVINRADGKSSEELELTKEVVKKLRVNNWRSSRIMFVSSVMGLGSKKKNSSDKESWITDQYYKTYKQQLDSFANPKDEFYSQLYKYDFLPANKEENQLKEERAEDKNELVFLNSGMKTLESEITLFAQKYALYNKCRQANQYLMNAINLVKEKIKIENSETDKDLKNLKNKQDKKKQALMSALDKKGDELAGEINFGYANEIGNILFKVYDEEREAKKIENAWTEIRKNVKREEQRNEEIASEVNGFLNTIIETIESKSDTWSQTYWEKESERYKEQCCKVITESPSISEEQKETLNNLVHQVDPIQIKIEDRSMDMQGRRVIVDRKLFFLIPIGQKFKLDKCFEEYKKIVTERTTLANQKAISENNDLFDSWRKNLKTNLETRIALFNPELRALAEGIGKRQKRIEGLKEQEKNLKKQQKALQGVLAFKSKEE